MDIATLPTSLPPMTTPPLNSYVKLGAGITFISSTFSLIAGAYIITTGSLLIISATALTGVFLIGFGSVLTILSLAAFLFAGLVVTRIIY